MATQTPEFQTAVVDSKKLTSKPNNEDLLAIYALYKIGTGEDITTAAKPGVFDLKGKAKYNAWKAEVDEGTTPEQAQEKYVAKVEELKEKYGYDAAKEPEAVGAQ
ncbi:acyl-CoA-binding protein [Dichotomopilus funicola]|uniref:Acyl-CoA-binding protein n=1 Tax=Dichotomopilus funicola TaxID=1934379 RepID=A0AAN6ZM88_9PEZI|nr:acyl-CoA-binding protein [Dichotomopilus funicola]